jgi:hypothetical protein
MIAMSVKASHREYGFNRLSRMASTLDKEYPKSQRDTDRSVLDMLTEETEPALQKLYKQAVELGLPQTDTPQVTTPAPTGSNELPASGTPRVTTPQAGDIVTFTSAAPPVRFPHVYGINMPSKRELVAAGKTIPEIAREIGADHLIYQEVEDMRDAIIQGSSVTELDMSCFTGEYVTGTVSEEYLTWVENNQSS